jgi:hypothetical protein
MIDGPERMSRLTLPQSDHHEDHQRDAVEPERDQTARPGGRSFTFGPVREIAVAERRGQGIQGNKPVRNNETLV